MRSVASLSLEAPSVPSVGLVLPAPSHDSGIDLVLSCVPF